MNRGYSVEEYKEKVKELRKIKNNIAISSDIIVGFCGESEEDFYQTIELCKTIKINQAFCFVYSPRPHTSAFNFKDDVSLGEKKRRLNILLQTLFSSWSSRAPMLYPFFEE